uniref:Secreted protein n=1 Tax=Mesocestoides corti TaxID=53468 RepID=A0A5K3F5M4_MESCO
MILFLIHMMAMVEPRAAFTNMALSMLIGFSVVLSEITVNSEQAITSGSTTEHIEEDIATQHLEGSAEAGSKTKAPNTLRGFLHSSPLTVAV